MTRKADIERLLRDGERVRARWLDVRLMDSPAGHVRIAIVVPKHGHTAVRRNKLKRQLREIARQELLPRPASRDVLVRARRDAYAATFPELRDAVTRIATAALAGAHRA